jgi:hypothetical protein
LIFLFFIWGNMLISESFKILTVIDIERSWRCREWVGWETIQMDNHMKFGFCNGVIRHFSSVLLFVN